MLRSPPYQRTAFTWLMYASLGYFAYFQAGIGALMPFLRADLGLSFTAGSLHFAAFSGGAVVAGLVGDRLLRQLGRRRTFWSSALVAALGIVSLAAGRHMVFSFGGCLLMGMAGTELLMTIQASLSAYYREQRAIAMAESNVVASGCAILSPLCIGAAESLGLGWQAGILLAAIAIALIFTAGRRVGIPESQRRPLPTADETIADGPLPLLFWAYGGVLFVGIAVEWCIGYWGATFLEQVVGLEAALAATSMSVFFVAALLARIVMSALTRWFPATKLLVSAFVLAVLGFPLFWLAPGAGLSLLGLFLSGLGIANMYPLVVANALGAAGERTDKAVAMVALIGGSGTLIVPFVVGMIADRIGLYSAYALPAALLVVGLVMVVITTSRADRAVGTVPADR